MSVYVAGTVIAASGSITGAVKAEGTFAPITGTATLPKAAVTHPSSGSRTILLHGGGLKTPEYLDNSIESAMELPYVGRSASGDEPGKPVWKDMGLKDDANPLNHDRYTDAEAQAVADTQIATHAADPDAHHDEAHTHDGLDGSGTIAHADTTGQGVDDHHAQSHAHDGVDGSGTVAHGDLTGVGADDHHTRYTDAEAVAAQAGLWDDEGDAAAAQAAAEATAAAALSSHTGDADAHHTEAHTIPSHSDANMTPGAGTDQYVIRYDDASGKFILDAEDVGVTLPIDADDVVVADTGDHYPTTTLTEYMRPTSDIATSGLSAWTNSATQAAYQQIDEAVLATADNIQVKQTSGTRFGVTWAGPTSGVTITRVRIAGYHSTGAAGHTGYGRFRRVAEGDESAVNVTWPSNTTGWYYGTWLTTNPFTGVAWTVADLLNLAVAITRAGTSSINTISMLYVEVEYTASVTAEEAFDYVGTFIDAHDGVADAHHDQAHDHSAAADGSTLNPAVLNLPGYSVGGAAPGEFWEAKDLLGNRLGVLRLYDGTDGHDFFPADDTIDPADLAFGDTASPGAADDHVAFIDHVHGMPADPVPAHEAAASAHTAENVDIVDAGGYYSGSDVEAALQELGTAVGAPSVPPALKVVLYERFV